MEVMVIKRILFLFLAWLLIAIYLGKEEKQIIQSNEYMVSCARSDGTIDKIALEEYVLGVVSAEMPASFEIEALKAQAVAARTFVLSRDLQVDDTTASQVYHDESQRREKWQESFDVYETKIRKAIDATKGEVLLYDGNYISALFFSSSNGKTENNEDYFNSNAIPYLRCVSSEFEKPIVEYQTFSSQDLLNCFGGSSITILNYTQSGRVNEVSINGNVYSGREIREKLGLNSSAFEITALEDGYAFTTYGYGHGVGMSQYGANGMAQNGYHYDEILSHYYQGVSIKHLE